MHYMLVNLLHSHYIQHVMYVITYPLHAFEDANARREQYLLKTYILQYIPGIYPVYTRHFAPAAQGLARLVAQPLLAASDLDALRSR